MSVMLNVVALNPGAASFRTQTSFGYRVIPGQ